LAGGITAGGGAAHEAVVAYLIGDDDEADARLRIARARASASEVGLINVELCTCWIAAMRGDATAVSQNARACADLATRLHYALYGVAARLMLAWADAQLGDLAGVARADAAYEEYRASGVRFFQPLYLHLLAEAHAAAGDQQDATELVRAARTVSSETGEECLGPRLTAMGAQLLPSA